VVPDVVLLILDQNDLNNPQKTVRIQDLEHIRWTKPAFKRMENILYQHFNQVNVEVFHMKFEKQ